VTAELDAPALKAMIRIPRRIYHEESGRRGDPWRAQLISAFGGKADIAWTTPSELPEYGKKSVRGSEGATAKLPNVNAWATLQ